MAPNSPIKTASKIANSMSKEFFKEPLGKICAVGGFLTSIVALSNRNSDKDLENQMLKLKNDLSNLKSDLQEITNKQTTSENNEEVENITVGINKLEEIRKKLHLVSISEDSPVSKEELMYDVDDLISQVKDINNSRDDEIHTSNFDLNDITELEFSNLPEENDKMTESIFDSGNNFC